MEHFSDEVWADFVRGVGTLENAKQVEFHLTDRCPQCIASLALWQQVRSQGEREALYTAPQDLVRLAKSQFAAVQSVELEPWAIATLVFDSIAQPLAVGVRGGAISARQVIYEAEGLTVDMRFERTPKSNTIAVAGQVLDREAPLCWLSNAAIVLLTEKGQMVTKTEANDFGEFQLEFEPQNQLRISVITQGRKTLRIALGNFD
jgi:hypothetical protein